MRMSANQNVYKGLKLGTDLELVRSRRFESGFYQVDARSSEPAIGPSAGSVRVGGTFLICSDFFVSFPSSVERTLTLNGAGYSA